MFMLGIGLLNILHDWLLVYRSTYRDFVFANVCEQRLRVCLLCQRRSLILTGSWWRPRAAFTTSTSCSRVSPSCIFWHCQRRRMQLPQVTVLWGVVVHVLGSAAILTASKPRFIRRLSRRSGPFMGFISGSWKSFAASCRSWSSIVLIVIGGHLRSPLAH